MKEIFAITGEQLEKLAAFGDVGCERDIVAVIMEVKKQKLPSLESGECWYKDNKICPHTGD